MHCRWKGNYKVLVLTFTKLYSQNYQEYTKPHNLKSKCDSRPIVMAPIILFSDDLSGSRSKKWCKFDVWCLSLAGLPISEARTLENINFLACSNNVFAIDMADALTSELLKLEEGVIVYDAVSQCDVLVLAPVLCVLCDNAHGSELCNHLGARAIKYCRRCMVSNCHYASTSYINYAPAIK